MIQWHEQTFERERGNVEQNYGVLRTDRATIAAAFVIITPMSTSGSDRPYRKWLCVVCGYVYDEALGAPEDGLPPGTRWEDVPDTWTCPDCGVTKDDFELYAG